MFKSKFFKYKNISIILFLLLFLPLEVNAISTASDGSTGGGGSFSGVCRSKSCLVGMNGFRIQIINENGLRFPETSAYNIVYSDEQFIKNGQYFHTWNNGTISKVTYIKNLASLENGGTGGTDKKALSDSIITENIFISRTNKLNSSNILTYNDKAWNMDKILTYYNKNNWLAKYGEGTEEKWDRTVWKFLEWLDLDEEKWKALDEKVKNGTYVVIEPTALIKYNSEYYWGTAYELGQLAYNDNYYDANMASLLGKRMPCSTYLTGTINDNKAEGIDYNSRTYFNGAIRWFDNIYSNEFSWNNNASVSQICDNPTYYSNQVFSKETIQGNYGTGMKVLWLGELNDVDELSCELVDGSNRNLQSEVDTAYKNGTLDILKSKYRWGIDYINSENKTQTTNIDWYIENCYTPPVPPVITYNCTPEYNVGNCSNGQSVKYSDSSDELTDDEYWNNCVFEDNGSYEIFTHKNSKPKIGGSLAYYDGSLSGNYCEVYCTENLVTNFDYDSINVQAGNHFVWLDHSVNGSRTCKTKSIKWDDYLYDIDRANKDVKEDYIDWQLEILTSKVNWTKSSTKNCDETCDDWETRTSHYKCHCTTSEDGKETCDTCTSHYEVCVASSYKDYNYYPSTSSVSFWGDSIHFSTTCGGPGYHPNVASKKRTYDRSLDVADGVTKEMTKCYDWNEKNIYNLNPVLSIAYSDNTYSYSGALKTDTDYSSVFTESDCVKITAPHYTGCSGTNCYTTDSVYKCGYNSETRSGLSTFKYSQNGIFQYVLKNNNKSFHSYELGSETLQNITTNYIDIGYSNFPVAYKTPNGVYGAGTANGGELSLYYSKLGHMISGSTALDSILPQTQVDKNDDYTKWQCKFNVNSNLITGDDDDKNAGINLIYRPIDLDNPFPDMDASGRNTGDNWCYFNNCNNNNNQNVENIIKNNRGVKGDDVYHKEPMYSFELSPADINEIRKYNKENSYTEYTGSLGGKTYDFVCNEGTGENCISEYLSKLIDMAGTGGTCSSRKARNNSLSSEFESCRY